MKHGRTARPSLGMWDLIAILTLVAILTLIVIPTLVAILTLTVIPTLMATLTLTVIPTLVAILTLIVIPTLVAILTCPLIPVLLVWHLIHPRNDVPSCVVLRFQVLDHGTMECWMVGTQLSKPATPVHGGLSPHPRKMPEAVWCLGSRFLITEPWNVGQLANPYLGWSYPVKDGQSQHVGMYEGVEMSITTEIADGNGITLVQAARRLPPNRNEKPVTLSCLARWIKRGVRGPDGVRVRLEAARLSGRWLTTPAALERFISPNSTGWKRATTGTSYTRATREGPATDERGTRSDRDMRQMPNVTEPGALPGRKRPTAMNSMLATNNLACAGCVGCVGSTKRRKNYANERSFTARR